MKRAEALSAFLGEVNARCCWQKRIENVGLLDCYQANGRIFLVEQFTNGGGWEVFIPASESGKIAVTLAAARAYITAGRDELMAEKFVRYYREWANLGAEDHERSGGTFTDFADYARSKADAEGGHPLTYLQWWNCRPCAERDGAVLPNMRSAFAVVEFDDGSYAMSPNHEIEQGRRWIVGRPA